MILVDDRTGSAEIADLLPRSAILCRLEYGDFAWSGNGKEGPVNVGVERKTVMDFLQSMTTGRLSGHQMVGLTQQYDWVYLLIEGVWRPDKDSGILQRMNHKGRWVDAAQGSRRFMARDVYNFVNTVWVMCGVATIITSNKWETAKWLMACSSWWEKDWGKHKSHLQFQKPVEHAQLVKPNSVTRMANQLSGVGWDKARSLGARFKTMKELMEASEVELRSVDGIGPKIAKSIREELNNG
jgi:ERCC4-type nuclease